MTGHVYVSDSDREFRAVYGVTPGEVDEAIEENRSRIIRKLNEWGQVWAVDEIVMNIWQELIEGGLTRWASYADRRPLGAFVNSLVDQKIGEWMNTDRPKYRSGMTYAPQNRRHRNNTHDGNGGPADEPDAERIRRQLRAEIRAAARDRLCEPDDVFGTDDGDMIGAPAGDKASWQEWQIGEGTQEQAHVSDDYRAAMRALSYKVCAKAGKKAWRILVQQAMQATGPQGDSLRREIRHWLESRHYGHDPSFDDYPYILKTIDRHRRNQ